MVREYPALGRVALPRRVFQIDPDTGQKLEEMASCKHFTTAEAAFHSLVENYPNCTFMLMDGARIVSRSVSTLREGSEEGS